MEEKPFATYFRFCCILFSLDIIFTFNTGILEKGNIIMERKKIAINYFKKNFLMDQISLFPLIIFFFKINIENKIYIYIIYFQIVLKLFILHDILYRLYFYFSFQKNKKSLMDLLKLMLIIVSVCHVFSLFWHGIAMYEINILNRTDTWIHA
jgi:hypothetical protein